MKRFKFYLVLLIISFLVGYLPGIIFEPSGGWEMAGLVFIPYWFFLGILDIVVLMVYEFKHLPTEPDFGSQRKYSIYFLVSGFACFLYKIFFFFLYFNLSYEQYRVIAFTELPMIFFILLILILNLYHFSLVKKNIYLARKIFIFLAFSIILLVMYTVLYMPDDFSRFNADRKYSTLESTISSLNVLGCETTQNSDICKKEIAIKTNDTKLCRELPDTSDSRESPRFECLYKVAMNTGDNGICNLMKEVIKDKSSFDQCSMVINVYNAKKQTVGMSNADILNKAVNLNDMNICKAIKESDTFSNCELAIAVNNKINDCERMDKFNGYKQIEKCYQYFGYNYVYQNGDEDGDGLSDSAESNAWHTNMFKADSDGDGYNDKQEVLDGTNPLDGLSFKRIN